MHDPASAKERAEARAAGGRARHGRTLGTGDNGPVTIETMADVVALLERAVNDTLALENSIARGRAVGYLAGALTRALQFAELEDRVTALERALEGRR